MSDYTDAGWPRPVNADGYPVPWVADADALGEMSEARLAECADGMVCQGCGREWENRGTVAYALLNSKEQVPPAESDMVLGVWQDSLLCIQCVTLALAWCPAVNEALHRGALQLFEVPTGIGVEIDVRWCRKIPLPEVRRMWPTPRGDENGRRTARHARRRGRRAADRERVAGAAAPDR